MACSDALVCAADGLPKQSRRAISADSALVPAAAAAAADAARHGQHQVGSMIIIGIAAMDGAASFPARVAGSPCKPGYHNRLLILDGSRIVSLSI